MRSRLTKSAMALLCLLMIICCSSSDSDPVSDELPEVFKRIYNVEEIYVDGDFVFIRTKDLPDHGSPFYPEGDPLYEAYNGSNPYFSTNIYIDSLGPLVDTFINPDLLEQDITMYIPLHPVESDDKSPTPLDAIGIALNGVPFYNQYNGARQLLDSVETNNLDQYNGHPTPTVLGAAYHYHLEPLWLTANNGKDALVGFLLDGFPVYGPEENGVVITNTDLDSYHGHFGVTADYPDGIYHYHITNELPWINGDAFFGDPGVVNN